MSTVQPIDFQLNFLFPVPESQQPDLLKTIISIQESVQWKEHDAKDDQNMTPLDWAKKYGHEAIYSSQKH